ncbi:uncharacterized protein TNIN_427161 [Trichonephila inaurata madagascariensis]|uniref:Uncharacterized protein n=1 Tax=Trichonephila inaurata madagascariensis TaxID=2747483 RepID=A0A8X6MGB0_9ARAC|nr:uncharacterized protein TNIN_427161 [Trichonephila inaurata madagascariensis]
MAFLSIAYALPYGDKERKSLNLKNKFMEYIATILFLIYVITDVEEIYESIRHLPIGLIFSSIVTSSSSVIMRIILISRRRYLVLTIENLLKICNCNSQRKMDKLQLIVGFSLCFIKPVGFLFFSVGLCLPGKEDVLQSYLESNCFGWSSKNKWLNCFVQISIDAFILNQQYVLPGFVVVLCCYMFTLLKQGVESFRKLTRHQRDFKLLFNTYLNYSERIFRCTEQIEKSTSFLLLILFGFMVCSIFTSSTFLFTTNLKTVDPLVLLPQLSSAIFILAGFYITSLQAVAIHDSAIKIKEFIHCAVAVSEWPDYNQKLLL